MIFYLYISNFRQALKKTTYKLLYNWIRYTCIYVCCLSWCTLLWAQHNSLGIQKYNWRNSFYTPTLLSVSDSSTYTFWDKAPRPNWKRTVGISAAATLAYTASMYNLNRFWYSNFERSSFHFYNDWGEWNQMDKVGHFWTAYTESLYMARLYKWAGVPHKKAAWIGGMLGWTYQASIELLDGFSERWGASMSDVAFNTLGSALFVAQELLWEEQRIKAKFSFHFKNYDNFDPLTQERVDDLFGVNLSERILKDYNAQTYWVSFNPFHFSPNSQSRFPKWLDIAVGYGVEDIFGGFENEWTLEDESLIDRKYIKRQRQYYLSVAIDWNKIHTGSKVADILLRALNIFKLPAPSLQLDNEGQIRFYPIYF